MKKPTLARKQWHKLRAVDQARRTTGRKPKSVTNNGRRRLRREIVTAWLPSGTEEVICTGGRVLCPEVLCLEKNQSTTLSFIEEVRQGIQASNPDLHGQKWAWLNEDKKVSRKMRRIGRFRDFSTIREMSTAVGVVVASEYDRNATLVGELPPPINLQHWQDPVFEHLYQLGYFEIIGLTEQLKDKVTTTGDRRTMRLISGQNAAELEHVSSSLDELLSFLGGDEDDFTEPMFVLRNAISEAMINVSKHAYPDDHEFARTHVRKWWVTATADRAYETFTIVIYDQGASIPVTFAKKQWSESAKDMIRKLVGRNSNEQYGDDGAFIRAAMEPGKSQTNQEHRGLGLPEMKSLIDVVGAGKLSIFSRGGNCTYTNETGYSHSTAGCSIGGTLIEWTLSLGQYRKLENG